MNKYKTFIEDSYKKILIKLSDKTYNKNIFITGKNMSGKSDILKKILSDNKYNKKIYFIDTVNRNLSYGEGVIFNKAQYIQSPELILESRKKDNIFNTVDCFNHNDLGIVYILAYHLFCHLYKQEKDFRIKLETFLLDFPIKIVQRKKEDLLDFFVGSANVNLSSGYQALLRIFTEIYNLQLEDSSRNIIIIDELDIHLDAMMCQRIVGKLKEVFPNIQLIATVHSINFFQENLEDDILMLKNQNSEFINASEIGNLSNAFNIIFYDKNIKNTSKMDEILKKFSNLSDNVLTSNDRTYIRKLIDIRDKTEEQQQFLNKIIKLPNYVTFEKILNKISNEEELSKFEVNFIEKETDLSEEDKSLKTIIIDYKNSWKLEE